MKRGRRIFFGILMLIGAALFVATLQNLQITNEGGFIRGGIVIGAVFLFFRIIRWDPWKKGWIEKDDKK